MPGIKAKRKQFVRKTLMRAKAQSERTAEQRQESPEEYAQTEVQQGISDMAARTGNTAKSTASMSYRKFRAMQEKRKNLTLQCIGTCIVDRSRTFCHSLTYTKSI